MNATITHTPALLLERITRRFGDLIALDGVTASFMPGRIHGVLGENGAGKSTLMRIAAGLLPPDDGSIRTLDHTAAAWSPALAAAAGIAMVHQHFMLVPSLTVAENCALGQRALGQWGARQRAAQLVEQIGTRTGLKVDSSVRVEQLSVGEQQRVEIIRALSLARRMLILDEPTAVLAPREVDQLFEALQRLTQQGLAIAFISHKLSEISRICDDLTILRKGRCVYSGQARGLSSDDIARHMVGTPPAPLPVVAGVSPDATPVLELRGVSAAQADGHGRILDVDLTLRSGEIVGVAGVEGNGQDVLAAAIVGVLPLRGGRMLLAGQDVTDGDVRTRAAFGLAHIPQDRLQQGLVPGMSLTENLSLREYRSPALERGGLIRRAAARTMATQRIAQFDVRATGCAAPVERLSGGNQQKLLLARELAGSPRVILAHNPVRGLDIAATRFVFAELLAQRQRGAAILLIHSDLDELLAIADRVVVMYAGRLITTDWPRCSRETIGHLMLGGAA